MLYETMESSSCSFNTYMLIENLEWYFTLRFPSGTLKSYIIFKSSLYIKILKAILLYYNI